MCLLLSSIGTVHTIFGLEKVFFPFNKVRYHWNFVMADMLNRKVISVCSLGDGKEEGEIIMRFLDDEHRSKMGSPLPNDWTALTGQCNRQTNAYDCGVFLLVGSQMMVNGQTAINLSQKVLTEFRDKMKLKIFSMHVAKSGIN